MTLYLTADQVQQYNAHFVGPNALRDYGLLDGAVMRPQSSAFGEDAFPTLHEKAAALLHGLARNHPFLDGNKRTAWAATYAFLLINGQQPTLGDDEVISLTIDTAEGLMDIPAIAARLKGLTRPIDFVDSE